MIPKLLLLFSVAFIAQCNGWYKIPKGNSFSTTPWINPQPQPEPQASSGMKTVKFEKSLEEVMNSLNENPNGNWPVVWQMKLKNVDSSSPDDVLNQLKKATSEEDWELSPRNFDETKESLHAKVKVPLPIIIDSSKPVLAFTATDGAGMLFHYGNGDTVLEKTMRIWNFEIDQFLPMTELEADLNKPMGFFFSSDQVGLWFYVREVANK